jgi:putative ABC transport system permease protein
MMWYRKLTRNVSLGIKTLLLHKLRSFLTMLGVMFGVGSVIAMLAVGEGASKDVLDRIRKLGSRNIIIRSQKAVQDEAQSTTRSFTSVYGLLYLDEIRIKETFEAVEYTVPVKETRKEGRLGSRTLDLRVVGTTSDWFTLVARPLVAGRVLTRRDMDSRAGAVVLTEYGARRLLATEQTIGKSLRIGGQYYEVVGIVQSESASGGQQLPDQQVDAYIPLNVARERYGDLDVKRTAGSFIREQIELHTLIVQVRSEEDVVAVAAGIEAMLKRFHKKEDYKMSVPLALLKQAEESKRMFNIVLGCIGGISLLVGGIGIMNIMLASVTERTREIGVRRAIGAKRSQIVGQFLIETVVLSTVGGLFGIGLGLFFPQIITYLTDMPTVVPMYSLVLSVGISMFVGIVFGLYPAYRAAMLDPIEALRHE